MVSCKSFVCNTSESPEARICRTRHEQRQSSRQMGWHRAELGSENGFRNERETGGAEGATQIYLRKLYHIAIEDQEEFQAAAGSEFSTRKVSYAPTREQSGHPLSLEAG